jgi:hypothetical protein
MPFNPSVLSPQRSFTMSIITTQEKTKALAEKFEQAIQESLRKGSAAFARDTRWEGLSEEERRERQQAEHTQYALQTGINEMFEKLAANVKISRYLVCVPSLLAADLYMGSNEVLRLIASNDPDFNRYLLAEYLRKDVFPRYQRTPTLRNAANFHRALNSKEGLHYTIGECYWLFQFCQWLGCTTASFSNAMADFLNGDTTGIEFHDQLQASNAQQGMLMTWARDQYHELIVTLHDL